MTHHSGARPAAAALALLATTFVGSVAVVESSSASPAATAAARAGEVHRTTITFTVDDCEGCKVRLEQGRETDDPQQPEIWQSKTKKVHDGTVSFTVRSKRTFGMSTIVQAPWEGQTGYLTTVAYRYRGKSVGDPVTFRQARKKKKASACWEGTRQEAVTLPLTVRKVMVDGVHERVKGSIAFLDVTESWLPPMRRAVEGVLGSQEANICG